MKTIRPLDRKKSTGWQWRCMMVLSTPQDVAEEYAEPNDLTKHFTWVAMKIIN